MNLMISLCSLTASASICSCSEKMSGINMMTDASGRSVEWPSQDNQSQFWMSKDQLVSAKLKIEEGEFRNAKKIGDFYHYCLGDHEKADFWYFVGAALGDLKSAHNFKSALDSGENKKAKEYVKNVIKVNTLIDVDPFAE